jgi:hypothetical protein
MREEPVLLQHTVLTRRAKLETLKSRLHGTLHQRIKPRAPTHLEHRHDSQVYFDRVGFSSQCAHGKPETRPQRKYFRRR